MKIFQRIVLLIKVLVMLSLGTSAAWASYPAQDHGAGFSTGMAGSGFHAIYADDSDPKGQDEGKSGTEGGDDSGDEEDDTQG
ncbi:hypothetical protein ACN1C3_23150 [Pseudomonas sp. H11T01]|uniref:hypothetical protein n=1 Tax=Pseudomonas sp. H11T01 TaxID=3402749 RepID=UPI003ACD36E4